MSAAVSDILCRRCGTPFPKERGKVAVLCPVCGNLRPDLEGFDEEDLIAAGEAPKPVEKPAETPAFMPFLSDAPAQATTAGMPISPTMPAGISSPATQPQVASRPYVAMSSAAGMQFRKREPGLKDYVGIVLLVIGPLAVATASALAMLNAAPDFSAGAWYAAGTVFVIILAATLGGGLIVCWVLYQLRVRSKFLLRIVFTALVAILGYAGVKELPSIVVVQRDSFPAFRF